MPDYRIDRSRLEALSTGEIRRILKEEKEDYTPEAVGMLEAILEERGAGSGRLTGETEQPGLSDSAQERLSAADLLVRTPGDAVHVLDGLLKRVLDGTMEPQVAQVASNIVMGILRAMEQAYMTDSSEDS